MNIIHCEQGSHAWHEARLGRVTASNVALVLETTKTGESAKRRGYRLQLIGEILSGLPNMDGYVSQDMKRGIEEEPLARAAYESLYGVEVDTCGFVVHPTIERSGCSPDGFVGIDGMVQFKNPRMTTHVGYMLSGAMPPEYEPQVMWEMDCCEREWCDFVSFDSRMPYRYQMFVVRVFRDEGRIAEIRGEVIGFIAEMDGAVEELKRLNPERAMPAQSEIAPYEIADLGITDADLPDWWLEKETGRAK